MTTLKVGIASYDEMKARSMAIARGERSVSPSEPKVWFTSTESFAKVLSAGNRELLRLIATRSPNSLDELAEMTGRAKSNLSRTLRTMEGYGLVRLERGADGLWPGAPGPGESLGSYQPLLALQEHGEALLWRRLSTLLARYPDWPVLHYGETESVALLRLAERQGASERERERLRARLVDVHQRLRRHWLLPVNSYGLKAVAGWLGFRWSQKGVDGARCLLWWRQWREGSGGPRRPSRGALARKLQRIFRYNQDDSLATWAVVSWLLDQDAALPPGPTGGG